MLKNKKEVVNLARRGPDGTLILNTEVDTSGLKNGMTSMKNAITKVGAAIGVAFSVKTFLSFSNAASKMATKTEASVNRLIDIYGKASIAVGDYIDTNARALGMSKSAAASYAAVYGNLFSIWADQNTNAKLTNEYLNMTAVLASKTGRTMEDVQERIRSGLLGNTEAIEDLGVFVNIKTIEITDAFKRIADGRSWDKLNAYEQSQVRTLAILEQATKKYGYQVEETTALTRARYNAAYEDMKNTWGQFVNVVLMPVLKVATAIMNTVTKAMQTLLGLTGKTIDNSQLQTINAKNTAGAIGSATDNQNALTDATKKTAKEQKKMLAGFDDLQIISSNASESAENSAKAVENAVPNIAALETVTDTNVPSQQSGKTEEKMLNTPMFYNFKAELDGLGNAFKKLGESLSTLWNETGLKEIVSLLAQAAVVAGIRLITGAVLILSGALDVVSSIIMWFVGLFTGDFNKMAESGMVLLKGLGKIIEGVFVVLLGQEAVDAIKKFFKEWGVKIATWFKEDVKPWFTKERWLQLLNDVKQWFSDGWNAITKWWKTSGLKAWFEDNVKPWFTKEKWSELWSNIKQWFSDGWANILTWWNTSALSTWFSSDGAIGKWFTWEAWQTLWSNLKQWFVDGFASIKDWLNLETFSKWFASDGIIGQWFTWNKWKTLFKDFKETISEGFKNAFNSAISIVEKAINRIIDKINTLSWTVPDWVPGIGGKTWGFNFQHIDIPPLARGAVIPPNREFLAVLGDQKQGVNIETPLATMIEAFQAALDSRNGASGGSTTVILEVDGREFGRAVVEQGNKETRRIGTRLVVV